MNKKFVYQVGNNKKVIHPMFNNKTAVSRACAPLCIYRAPLCVSVRPTTLRLVCVVTELQTFSIKCPLMRQDSELNELPTEDNMLQVRVVVLLAATPRSLLC
jgi:hypothetical protein